MTDRPEDTTDIDALFAQAQASEDDETALALYRRVLELDPDRRAAHYDIGLIHKYRGEWADSLRSNRRAVDLDPGEESANWNLAIAATALRDWAEARAAWARLGIEIPGDAGPIEADFGITPVRLNPDDHAEVIWARRICPVRARLENIPLADSGFRWGDVVLHDGAPVGTRVANGRDYSVFNELELFEAAGNGTFEAEVRADDDATLQALEEALDAAGCGVENWTQSLRTLCRKCSEGVPHEHHGDDHAAEAPRPETHVFGISAGSAAAIEAVLRAWDAGAGRVLRFETRLAPR